MSKKKVVAGILGLGLVIGIAFNTGATARYIKELDTETQTITTATFQVESIGALGTHENFKPGDSIQDDKITLINNNDYPVEFIITLNDDSENVLWNYLKLQVEEATISNGEEILDDHGQGNIEFDENNVYALRLDAGETKEVFSKIYWKVGDVESYDATGKTLEIAYDITAKQIIETVAEDETNDSV